MDMNMDGMNVTVDDMDNTTMVSKIYISYHITIIIIIVCSYLAA